MINKPDQLTILMSDVKHWRDCALLTSEQESVLNTAQLDRIINALSDTAVILQSNSEAGSHENKISGMREKCLELALSINQSPTIESTLKDADRFLKWIYLG